MSLKKIRFDIVHNKGFHLKEYSDFFLLITAIIGTIFIVCELKEIRKQNELTELALRQGCLFRPIRHLITILSGTL